MVEKIVTETVPAPPVVTSERRRPGRLQNPSPELIALMRRPSPEKKLQIAHDLALYDAPNFTPPLAKPTTRADFSHTLNIIIGGTMCAVAWAGIFKIMLAFWG